MVSRSLRAIFAALMLTLSAFGIASASAQQTEPAIPESDVLQPAALVTMLSGPNKPLVFQVGSHVMYAEAHIPESEYAGPARTADGLEALRKRVATVDKNQTIVIYCGCCPWIRCPNIRPAYAQLKSLGFTHVRALYLPSNFGADWVSKGYPVAQGR